MNQIQLKDFNLGGLSDSVFQGVANSMAEIVGFDIHSEPGILKHNQKMTKESGTTVDDLVKTIVSCTDGNTYLFGSTNGKIWKRDSGGAYSLAATASPAAGTAGIKSAYEYQGYIYYAMQSRLGRVAVGAPTDWTGRSDNWATFTNADADFHPMSEVNQVLYIGDGKYVAQVDAGTFTADALDLKTGLRVKALGKFNTDLLIGTYLGGNIVNSEILRWNTWSVSYTVSDDVPEIGVNGFLKTDNFVLASCGTKGNIYLYNGSALDNFKRIPGSYTGTNAGLVHTEAVVNYFGLPLFGVSNSSGNPAKQGIYSLGGYDRNYNKVLNLEYTVGAGSGVGNTENVTVGALSLYGNLLLASWYDGNGTPSYGVSKLDTSAKTPTAYFATRVINIARNDSKTVSGNVGYRSLPNDSQIKVYYKSNYNSAWVEATTVVDTIRKVVMIKEFFPESTTLQVKVESIAGTGSYVNTAPEIESLELNFE